MTSGGHGCTAWAGDGSCGAPARLYPRGWRCADHTPARTAGVPEPPEVPPPPLSAASTTSGPALTRAALKLASDDRRERMMQAALDAAGRGWHVFPLKPGSKRPAFPDHDERHCDRLDPRCRDGHTGWEPRATLDEHRITRAWTVTPYNVGIATGPARLVVVDLDTPKPADATPAKWDRPGIRTGADVLAALAVEAGQPYPADTYTVSTPSGGTHLYFTAPAGTGFRNTAGALGWLIDTRAGGGYVVAAGSEVDGRGYVVEVDGPAAELPAWLTDRLRPAELPPQRPVQVTLPNGRAGAYLRAAVEAELARVTGSPSRGRNTALYRAAVALGQLVAGGALAESDVTAWLTAAAGQVGQKPGETARTIASGLRAGAKRPRSVAE
jgi:hypothetical protein